MEDRDIRDRLAPILFAVGAICLAVGVAISVLRMISAHAVSADALGPPTPTIDISVSPLSTPSPSPIDRAGAVRLPRRDAEPSLPEDGRSVLSVDAEDHRGHTHTRIEIFADGRIIWRRDSCHRIYGNCEPLVAPDGPDAGQTGWVEQRLTRDTVSMLRHELRATGFFERDHFIDKAFDDLIDWFSVRLLVHGRWVSVETNSNHLTTAVPPHQHEILGEIERLVADPSTTLRDASFVDRDLRAFVATRYVATFRWRPSSADLDELPSSADALVTGECSMVTTDEARAIVNALVSAGIPRLQVDRSSVAFAWGGDQPRQQFRLEPVLPDGVGCP